MTTTKKKKCERGKSQKHLEDQANEKQRKEDDSLVEEGYGEHGTNRMLGC